MDISHNMGKSNQIQGNFFTMSLAKHWNKLPRGDVECPSLEVFKTGLDKTQCHLIWLYLL